MSNIGTRLRDIIEDKHITVNEISEATGISKSTIFRILSNSTQKPSKANLSAIANYLKIDLEWLITGETSEKDTDPSILDNVRRILKFDDVSIDMYRTLLKLLVAHSEIIDTNVKSLKFKNDELKSENASLKTEINKLKGEE